MLRLLLSCVLLYVSSGDVTFGPTNSLLDPNRITWWKSKWAPAPITMTSNHRVTVVDLTFYICPTTSIVDGVFEVTFPAGFILPSGTNVNGQVYQVPGVTYVGGQDKPQVVTGVKTPSAVGSYGPFALRTRYSTSGQQVDVNLNFGSVYVYGDSGSLASLTVNVAEAPATGTIINRVGNTLSFKFTIGVSLWRYDTFVITSDYRWTVAGNAACSSYDYPGKWNNFNGTNSANPHSLECVVTGASGTSQVIYIYGLAVDGVDIIESTDNKYVDLRINSVNSPNAVYTGSAYNWKVSTVRFGTTTTLETGGFNAGPLVTNDIISVVTWLPTWGSAASDLITNQLLFMDLSFTVTNAIPATTSTNGYILITVTETLNDSGSQTGWVGTTGTNCYVVTYLDRSVDCQTTGAYSYTITGLPSIAYGTSITIRSVVKITSAQTVKVTSIETYVGTSLAASTGGYPVDIASNRGAFTLSTSASIVDLTSFEWFYRVPTTTTTYTTAGGHYTAGVLDNNNLQFVIKTPANPTAASIIDIYCPFSATSDDFGIAIPAPGYVFESAATTGVQAAPSGTLTTAPTFSAGTKVSPGNIRFTAKYSTGTYDVNQRLDISTSTGSSYIQLPKVAQNYATAYECRAMVTVSTLTYTGFVRLGVAVQGWPATTTLKLPCLEAQDGVPAMVSINPVVPMRASGTAETFYVELEFALTNSFNAFTTSPSPVSGTSRNHDPMHFAVAYPFAKAGSVPKTAQFYVTSAATFVAFGGFEALVYSSTVTSFYFPIGGITTGAALSATLRSLYFQPSDPRYKFVSNEGSVSAGSPTAPGAAWSGNTWVTTSGINGDLLNSLKLNVFLTGATTGQAWFYVTLPAGWTMQPNISVKLGSGGGSSIQNPYVFSSPHSGFKFPGVLFSNQIDSVPTYKDTPAAADLTNGTLVIEGLTIALGVNSAVKVRVVAGIQGSACYGNLDTSDTFDSQAGIITSLSITPSSIKVRGPDGVNISHTVTFTLPHKIPAGGSINMTYNTGWVPGYTSSACSYCEVTGVTGATCVLSGNTVTVGVGTALTTASATVKIAVFGLFGPTSPSPTNSSTPFITSLTSNLGSTSGSVVIDQLSTYTGSAVVITTGSGSGSTTWITKKTYPSTAGTTNVDLYLRFSLPHALPACGQLAITIPLAFKVSGDVKNICFLSPIQYSSCIVSGTTVTVGLKQGYGANEVLELYLDGMVDNPTTTTPTTAGFKATATWGGSSTVITTDADSGTIISSQTFTASPMPSTNLAGSSSNPLTFSPKTAGEAASYVFDFTDTASFSTTDALWVVFPAQYDYFIGDTSIWFTNEPTVYYIDCSCVQLGSTWCKVDHNIVIVTGSNVITGSTQIVLTINNVTNPAAGQTGIFKIYHVDGNGNFVSVNESYGSVTIVEMPGNDIGVRSLTVTDSRLFKTSDYTWRLYISDTMYTDSQLQVLFPKEYTLRLFDKKDTFICSSTWADISASASDKSQRTWNSASTCNVYKNLVTLPAPTTQIPFINSNIVTFTLQTVTNPQFGQSRTAFGPNQDFDVTDSVLWPLWLYWTSKFTFFIYRTGSMNLGYTSKSNANLNSAYANFYDGYRPILVNGFSPQSKSNRIVVYAGTQTSDISITTSQPLAAKQIVFTPSTNSRTADGGRLKYTSATDQWTLYQSYSSIHFRICAAIDTSKGLYYIDWSTYESKQTGVSDVQYDVPASTLIEVVPPIPAKYMFIISNIPSVATGFSSVPIKISISNPPCSDVSVNIAVSGLPSNVSILPSSLIFSQDISEKYFQIQVGSGYDVTQGAVQTLVFTVTGTDAYAYGIAETGKFTITQASEAQTSGNVVSWGLGQPGRTYCSISPSTDEVGIIYYHLAGAGTIIPPFSSLKSSLTSLIYQNNSNLSPDTTQETDPRTGETWVEFQRRLYKQHLQTQWIGAISMYSSSSVLTLSFTWLWANTQYQISGYLDNLGALTPAVHTEYFTTLPIPDSQPVSLKFSGQLIQSYGTRIAIDYADVIGVNPGRLTTAIYAISSSRTLQSISYSTFTYTLLVNRFSESPTPADQAKVGSTAFTELSRKLSTDGIKNTLMSVTNNVLPSRFTPNWSSAPISSGSTASTVSLNLRANTAGSACCVAVAGSLTPPTSEQVMVGLDASNSAVPGTCIVTDLTTLTNSMEIAGLAASTPYYVYCSAMDNYPLWPTHMAFTIGSPMTPVAITTLKADTIDSAARWRQGIMLLVLLLS